MHDDQLCAVWIGLHIHSMKCKLDFLASFQTLFLIRDGSVWIFAVVYNRKVFHNQLKDVLKMRNSK